MNMPCADFCPKFCDHEPISTPCISLAYVHCTRSRILASSPTIELIALCQPFDTYSHNISAYLPISSIWRAQISYQNFRLDAKWLANWRSSPSPTRPAPKNLAARGLSQFLAAFRPLHFPGFPRPSSALGTLVVASLVPIFSLPSILLRNDACFLVMTWSLRSVSFANEPSTPSLSFCTQRDNSLPAPPLIVATTYVRISLYTNHTTSF